MLKYFYLIIVLLLCRGDCSHIGLIVSAQTVKKWLVIFPILLLLVMPKGIPEECNFMENTLGWSNAPSAFDWAIEKNDQWNHAALWCQSQVKPHHLLILHGWHWCCRWSVALSIDISIDETSYTNNRQRSTVLESDKKHIQIRCEIIPNDSVLWIK